MHDLATYPSIAAFRARDLVVISGANDGDPLGLADDLVMDDTYRLHEGATPARLSLVCDAQQIMRIAPDSAMGRPGAPVQLDSALTLMAQNAPTTEVLTLVQVDAQGRIEDMFAVPLAPIATKTDYQLVGIETRQVMQKLAQLACVSFVHGTHITMASGRQRPIEALHPGDEVLTRDDGVHAVRWIGHSTVRAVGRLAPVRIAAGTLNNTRDLIVSPDHRLLVYQRTDQLGAGRSEVLVKARHLVNGTTVTVDQGGFVDYYQLLFDTHQIIYAEGIAAESMFVDGRTEALLPADLHGGAHWHHTDHMKGLEVHKDLLDGDSADRLRRASGC